MAAQTGGAMSDLRLEALAWVIGVAVALLGIRLCNAQSGGWVDQLRSPGGTVCCYDNDGRRLDDPEWRVVGSSYEVLFTEGWLTVSEAAVVNMRNQDGIARVWSDKGGPDGRVIRCFLPGALG